MKRLIIGLLTVGLTLCFSNAFAQPSAKATAQLGDLSVVDVSGYSVSGEPANEGDTGWVPLFTQIIKTPTGKDLFVDVSLECGITTDTAVMSKKLARAIANAEGTVKVQVKVDGVAVPVNESGDTAITFARRHQSLIAEFAGDFSECMTVLDSDGDGIVEDGEKVVVDWACADPEMLQLILDTMQANSFNFILPDLLAGEHIVQVEAKLSYLAEGNLEQETIDSEIVNMAWGEAFARAYLGNGSVTVEVVRMIKDEDVVVDLDLVD